jgi:actin-related protein
MMFEKYQFAGSTAIQPVLALHAKGLLIGVIVNLGDGITHLSLTTL